MRELVVADNKHKKERQKYEDNRDRDTQQQRQQHHLGDSRQHACKQMYPLTHQQ